jgi:hypothetical protein
MSIIPEPINNVMVNKWVTEPMKELAIALSESKYQLAYSVELTPSEYSGNSHVHGTSYGHTLLKPDNPPLCDERHLMLKITFITNKQPSKCLDQLRNRLSESGRELKAYSVYEPRITGNRITKGLYKKKDFDTAYQAYKLIEPNLSQQQFAYVQWIDPDNNNFNYDWLPCYNHNLVEERHYAGDNDSDCVEPIYEYYSEDSNEYHVTINLLSSDIEINIPILKSALLE